MKIAIISAAWGRLPLGRIWWQGAARMREHFSQAHGIEAQVYVAGSEIEHVNLCSDHLGYWVQCENRPLGRKLNTVTKAALKDGADYIFVTGMDDFYSPALIERYLEHLRLGPVYFGLRGVYMYEPTSDRMMLFQTDPKGNYPSRPGESRLRRSRATPIGAGRMIHRSLFAYHTHFWEPERNQGLDASFNRTINPPRASAMIAADSRTFALDVKTKDNIWSFDTLADIYPNCVLSAPHDLSALPEWPEIRALVETP